MLQSLIIIGALSGLTLGAVGTSAPWFIPYIFTSDSMVIGEVTFLSWLWVYSHLFLMTLQLYIGGKNSHLLLMY